MITLLTHVVPSHAASFDCSKATIETEIAICNDPELSALDELVGALWNQEKPWNEVARKTQGSWIEMRDDCVADNICLKKLYREKLQSEPFNVGNFDLVEMYDFSSRTIDYYMINWILFAYNAEIYVSRIGKDGLTPISWLLPEFDENIETCNLKIMSNDNIDFSIEPSVVGIEDFSVLGEISVFTNWVGHGDMSQDITFNLVDDNFIPVRGLIDNCEDGESHRIPIYFSQ